MSYNQIYPPLSVTMPKHYQAIGTIEEEEKREEDYNSRLEKQRNESEEFKSRVAKQQEEAKERIRVREQIERNKTFCERYAVDWRTAEIVSIFRTICFQYFTRDISYRIKLFI